MMFSASDEPCEWYDCFKSCRGLQAFGSCRPQHRSPEPTSGDPTDSTLLISFPKPDDSVLSLTPFGGKVEMVLRMAGIEFEGVVGDIMNKEHAPKGKLPVLRHGGNTVADSSCIFDYLQATYPDKMKSFAPKDAKTCALLPSSHWRPTPLRGQVTVQLAPMTTLDSCSCAASGRLRHVHAQECWADSDLQLPQAQLACRAAVQLALQRMLEEDMYFCILYANWYRDDAFAEIAKSSFGEIPALMRPFITRLARSSLLSAMDGQVRQLLKAR